MKRNDAYWRTCLLAGAVGLVIQSCAMVTSRSLLPPEEEPGEEFGGYGFVVFTSAPNPTGTRETSTCQAFLRSFPELSEYGDEDPSGVMVMYWPVSEHPIPSQVDDCQAILEIYDFARANKVSTLEGFAGAAGPVLVGFSRGTEKALVLDLSDFTGEDIDRGFRIWRDHVSRDPSTWREGFRLTVLREAFRNLIQTYGETILEVLER